MALFAMQPVGGYQKQSVSTAAGLANVPRGATVASLVCETQAIRWRDDGTDPTATDGMPVPTGQQFNYSGDLSKFRMIAQTSTATVHVAYYAARK